MTIELAYKRSGQGEPLVLIHGIGHRLEAFDAVFHELAERYDVIAVDMPGFGRSPGLPAGTKYSVHSLADTIADNFALWGIERPHVVGNSLGGAVAVLLGQTGRARTVTGLSPAGWFRPWSLLQAAIPLLLMRFGSFAPAFILKLMGKTAIGRFIIGMALYRHPQRHSPEASFGDAMAMRNAQGFWPMFLGSIPWGMGPMPEFKGQAKVPTTIAWGDKDILLNPGQGKRAIRTLRGAKLITLYDCGHVPMADSPLQVISAIDRTTAQTHLA